ncbi:hypothetical protein V6N13_031405 [Hibiscus sabdariffa]|uniref:Uncharacterized protein n=2 Tax=Hibiscus sabdariffa TaxID=183260 RepID=A0ABR1ZD57_9ROSI
MSMEAAAEKRMKRQFRAALRQKVKELEMLKSKKQSMLAEQTAKEKVIADFMLLTESIEKNDTETAQKFDEKAMKSTILSMLKDGDDHSGNNGGKEA